MEFAICAVVGIALADQLSAHAPLLWKAAGGLSATMLALAAWMKRLDGPRVASPSSPSTRLALWVSVVALFCCWTALREASNPGRLLAADLPPNGRPITAIGVIDAEVANTRFPVILESADFGDGQKPLNARVQVQWSGDLPSYGDRIEIAGSLRNITPPRNPGGFDLPAHRRREGIYSKIVVHYPSDAKVIAHDQGNPLVALSFRLRHWMEKTMALDLADSPQITGVMQSMVLGARGDSLGDVRPLFQNTGTLHLFAVSGLNIAMLAAMSVWILQTFCLPRRTIALIVIPILWCYCFITGLSASSLRATIMATVVLAGMALDRPSLSWNVFGASALAILIWEPNQLFLAGFQLSFLLVAALLLFAKPVQNAFSGFGQPDPFLPRPLWTPRQEIHARLSREMTGAFGVSLVAWLSSLPLTAYYFHLFSPSSVPANLVAGVLAWFMLALGLASSVAGTCWQWLAMVFNNANWGCTKALLGALSAFAAIPGSHSYVEFPSGSHAPCEIEVLDLAGGGANHLRFNTPDRSDWMIDCGSASAFVWTVAPYLRSQGINTLEGLIITHGDSQHLGGAIDLLNTIPTGELLDAPYKDRSPLRRKIHSTLANEQKGKAILRRGDRIPLAPGATLHVLYPPTGLELRSANEKPLILRLDLGEGAHTTRILFTSDAGFIPEKWLLENADPSELRADILIKGKHSADFSGTPEFLEAVRPALLVASGADFPPQERIDPAWAERVRAAGIQLMRQDQTGAVRIKIDPGHQWKARGFLDGSTATSPN